MRITKSGPKRYHIKHRVPVLVGPQAAWEEMATDTLTHAKADAQLLLAAYRNFQNHLERYRSILRWIRGGDAAVPFQVACETADISPESAVVAITKAVPEELTTYLADPHAHCPLCMRPR